jgi:2-succinyl-5-enolpyruvyl-6-hydroxy-3-cyclohexene-1-carboxylate synthase
VACASAQAASGPAGSYAYTTRFFAALAQAGLRHVVVSPGSRSTPLAISARWQPSLRCWVQIDERSAGFFALGLARATREPVALVCTSGTAAANYLPAVVEANHARVPLVVLTADRPPELRDWDAGQTIDQLKLYGSQLRWFAELPVPSDDDALLRHAVAVGGRAVAEARGQAGRPGPVHLNWPLREPLEPGPGDRPGPASAGMLDAHRGTLTAERVPGVPTQADLESLAALFARAPRGVIACGPLDADAGLAAAVTRLARAWGWPVLADPASNLRNGAHVSQGSPVVANGDLLLRSTAFAAAHAPDLVLRLGSTPVSKALRLWLEAHPPREYVVVDPGGGWSDPSHLATRVVAADPTASCDALAARAPEPTQAWLSSWCDADRRAAAAVELALHTDDRLLEPRAVRTLCDALPEDALLYVSNSMPIRHLDACLARSERRLRVLANRGANGIDGMVSSALGAAAAELGSTVLLTGDLALVHDLGGLAAAARLGSKLVIVVLDNDGGGIFSFLPVASCGEEVHFEELFRTRHGLDFEHAARLAGARYHRTVSLEHYRAALKESFRCDGLSIVHVPCDRDAGVSQFRALASAVARACEAPHRGPEEGSP